MATTCELIAKNVLGSDTASVTFSSIPGTYTDLLLVVSGRSSAAATFSNALITFNGSTSNYTRRSLYGFNSSAASDSNTTDSGFQRCYITGANATANTFGNSEVYIPNYAGSTNKSVSVSSVTEDNSIGGPIVATAAVLWSSTAAITSIGMTVAGGGNFVTNSSFYLFGITKA